MADCNAFTQDDFRFPARIDNRAALERIRYRIAHYPAFVEQLIRQINNSVELGEWSHREPDDPGIALLEGTAMLGDILTFYQEHYANEAFLRTARWRESISDLVRLYGYRLAPGLGGRATFAFEIKGDKPVTITKGLPLKADLEAVDEPGEFETDTDLVAYPHLSRFHLYRTRHYGGSLYATTTEAEVDTVGGQSNSLAIGDLDLKAGDKLMLIPGEPGWTTSGSTLSTSQKAPQVLKVKEVTRHLGRTVVKFETPFASGWGAPALAYRIGRSFRHFGHNAPETYISNTEDVSGKINGARENDTWFQRHVDVSHDCANTSASIDLPGAMIPLDSQVDDLTVKSRLIVQTEIRASATSAPIALTSVKTINGLRSASIGFASVTGPTTLVTLDSPLIRHLNLGNAVSDLRDYQIFEVTSAPIRLKPRAYFYGTAFASGANALNFWGTQAEAGRLAGRKLILKDESADDIAVLTCTNAVSDFPPSGAADEDCMWVLSFDKAPTPFTRADFDEKKPSVTVFGNLVEATQGKAQSEVTLGNGDARQRFQTFKLPKSPLTYLSAKGVTPPYAPELTIYVGGRAWTRVASLFGRKPDEEIYVVRQDDEGESYVQFGDGKTGARLTSGVKNVTAVYRTGVGGHGLAKQGSTPLAGKRVEQLDKVQLPGLVAGGAKAEAGDRARETAPGKVQSLGRMVSVQDFETEVLSIPGVTAATASWNLQNGVPTLLLRVLLEAGREDEFEIVRGTIADYQRSRGPDRFPVAIEQASLRYAYLSLLYGYDPALRKTDVESAIKSSLGLVDDEDAAFSGLFGLNNRRLGAKEYASRIEGFVQQVSGINWCQTSGLGLFAAGATDPTELTAPAAPQPLAQLLAPSNTELLQLYEDHLSLVAGPFDTAEKSP